MPPVVECVCVFCGAAMGSRRGLRIHVRKMHAQQDALREARVPASDAAGLGSGPQSGRVVAQAAPAFQAKTAKAPCASAGAAVSPASDAAGLGCGPQSGRVVALAAPVFRIGAPKALRAPQALTPATLHFAHPGGASHETLAQMRISFLLNPV